MKYFVFSCFQYGSSELFEFDTKEEALTCVGKNSGEDSYCRLIEGNEIMFKIRNVAEEMVE